MLFAIRLMDGMTRICFIPAWRHQIGHDSCRDIFPFLTVEREKHFGLGDIRTQPAYLESKHSFYHAIAFVGHLNSLYSVFLTSAKMVKFLS